MLRPYSRHALAVVLTLELGAIALPAQVQAQSPRPALSRNIPPRWTPPKRIGAPNKREGAATRGCLKIENPITPFITALEPESILVSTIAEYPTLFWYWPYKLDTSDSVSMQFELRDKTENLIYKQVIPIPSSPGIVSLDLSTLPKLLPLEIGNTYQWRLIPRCNGQLLGENSINGWVERIEPDPALVNKIQQATLEERVALYANAYLWYETLATLAELRRSNPNEPNLAEDWTKLLGSVDLNKIAAEPLIALKPVADNTRQPQPTPPQLADVQGNWAQSFIMALAERDIISGFGDRTFRPNAAVTRAEFAAIINKAFPTTTAVREATNFVDVPVSYWAADAIQTAYQKGFLAGYPNNRFNPEQNITRAQALIALTSGLNLSPTSDPINFQDASQIPDYARNGIAAATANGIVVNYPNAAVLNSNQIATRADIAAFVYQALVKAGTVPPIAASEPATQYIVGYQPPTTPTTPTPETPKATVTPEQIQKLRERAEFLQNLNLRQVYLSTPSSSGGSPSGFGLNWSQGFLGVGFVERNRFDNEVDAGIAGGIGFGDARTAVGLEVVPTITNIINGDGSFPEGQVDFKVHRLLDRDTSIAVGVENLIQFGSTDAQSSTYGVISRIFRLQPSSANYFSRLYTSVGIGGGRFRSVDDINNGNDSVNVFGSVGLRVAEPFSIYADYTGQDLNLGVSLLPLRNIPLVITPGIQDVFNNADDPDGGGRFSLSVGYSLSF